MTATAIDTSYESSRAKRLKAATSGIHERLDQSIMQYEPFADRRRYGRFVTMQYLFHREIDALYTRSALEAWLPDLAKRRKLPLIAMDLADLGLDRPENLPRAVFDDETQPEVPAALGWLYVAEGSNLGAAFLLKGAERLGLSDAFGARHMAAAPEGRGLHWKTFVAALDGLTLSDAEDERAIAGARAAFARVQGLVEEVLPD